MWSARLIDSMSGECRAPLTVLGGSGTDGPLNDATSGSLTVPARDLARHEGWLTEPWSGSVLMCFNEHPVTLGPILADPAGSLSKMSIKTGGFFDFLEDRYATPADFKPGQGDDLARAVLSLTGSLGNMCWDLVQAAMNRPQGWFPIRHGSPVEAVDRVRNYEGHNITNNSIRKLIQEITEVINGPDVAFRPSWVEKGRSVEWVMVHGTEGLPPIAQEHEFTIDLTAPTRRIMNPEVAAESGYYARAYMVGAGEGEGALIEIVDAPLGAHQPWRELVRTDSSVEIDARHLLQQRGGGLIAYRKLSQFSVTLDAADPVMPVWLYHTGDAMNVRVPPGYRHVAPGLWRCRIVSRRFDLLSNKVTVELQPEEMF